MASIDELASLYGIGHDYCDYRGERQIVSADTKRRLLHALGHPVPEDARIGDEIQRRLDADWTEALPPVRVLRQGQPADVTLTVPADESGRRLHWRIALENAASLAGDMRPADSRMLERRQVAGREMHRYSPALPADLPLGYHELSLTVDGEDRPLATSNVIVVPERCYQPPQLARGERLWGLAVQLYTLRSDRDWGIGDFGDLKRLVQHAARQGAGYVGLNPVHALYPSRPAHCSPYGPSSRTFLNVLYIDVPAVPEYAECEQARKLVSEKSFQKRLEELRAADLVDYPGVAALKLPALRELYRYFRAHHVEESSERARAFRQYVEHTGEALAIHALFDSLTAHFRERDPDARGWHSWPRAYRDPRSEEVRRFAREHAGAIEFHQYLQWLADEQLAAVQASAKAGGMLLGLYRDLAVGVDGDGADAWANQGLYRAEASIGAPPDALAQQGQNWGLPPIDPNILRQRAYRDFAELLRSNMRHCGALRIDHVMALMRLWWIPENAGAAAGAYVTYPLEDMLGILALESQRSRCLIIGEDLGTVPDEIRRLLPAADVYSYRVLYFEKTDDGNFKAPAEYIAQAMATITTHDLPPLRSYWEIADLALRDELELFPSGEARERSYSERESDRRALLRALAKAGLLPPGISLEPDRHPELPWELAAAVHAYLARSAAALMAVQAEDWLMMRNPVNLPGTSIEHPNWRRKLTHTIEDIFSSARILSLCAWLTEERRRH